MKRLNFIDTAKGICMLLIILGHCVGQTDIRYNSFLITWIYSFHTTTFFIVTGMLMEHIKEYERPFAKSIISNAKRLLIPYFVFQILYSIWYCVMNGFSNIKWLLSDILLLVGWNYASWFLLALFIAKILTLTIYKTTKKKPIIYLLMITMFLIALLLCKLELNTPLYWIYQQGLRGLLGLGFIFIGIIFYHYKEYLNKTNILIVSLCISLISSFANSIVSIFFLVIGNPFLYVISAISGAIFILSLSHYIKNRFITFFSDESITAMGTHQLILWSFPFKSILLWFVVTPLTALAMYIVRIIKQHMNH